ncbi:MAG: tripartite tricarboxylate transporter substrate binding protein [Burkholderiales bacterium]
MLKTLIAVIGGSFFVLHTASSSGADYPVKPVRIYVGASIGGGVDVTARVLAIKLSEFFKQQFIVENRAGASGNIGTEAAARAVPDGYVILMGTIGTLTINPSLYKNLSFDTVRDFAPIVRAADATNILAVHPSVPARSVKELIAVAKQRPGEMLFGSPQNGTAGHLAGELFNSMAGVKLVHIPYKGGAPAMIDLISGQIHLMFATASTSVQHIRTGKLRALAVTTAKRAALVSELPTMMESGMPGFEVNNWYGLVAPVKVPPDIIATLNRQVRVALESPDVKDSMQKQGIDPAGGTPDEFGAYIKSELAKWSKVIRVSGATAQ